MKYLLIFLLSFAFVLPVYAAKTVQGSVPVVKPLQPPAIGVSANLNQNIQEKNITQTGEANAPSPTPTFVNQQNPQSQGGSAAPTTAAYKKSSSWVWWALIILGLIILGFWVKRRLEQP